eukprot:TRINITY_DN726_c0_g1_i11.p3 TRINITY_DN726_c0_g1~~TRINITY_DN726_c0_g1_i11.p3  ORF type:complete len:478 (+),score=98.90 TRINITY_DN726_c0_g1_i11:4695-6128(+)
MRAAAAAAITVVMSRLLTVSHRSPRLYTCWRSPARLIPTSCRFTPTVSPPSIPALPATCPSRLPPRARALCTSDSQSLSKPHAIQAATGTELVLSPPALVVTREYEWANIIIGFEQANKYTIRAAPGGQVVGYIAEEASLGGAVTRNVLRTRRPFKATVFDKDRNIIFQIRRPLYLVSSSIFVETPQGEVLGEVHMHWHMWRRRYDLYVDKAQFARVDSGFLAVDFDMHDVDGNKIASVNKDFTGFARELFTDARQYVLRLDPSYGLEHDESLVYDAATVSPAVEPHASQKLAQRERAVILGAAIAIDFDYFSLHSRGPGPGLMMMPPVGAPTPVPPGAGAGAGATAAGADAGAAVGADVLSDAMRGSAPDAETPYEINDADIKAGQADSSSQPGGWQDTQPFEQDQFGDSNQAANSDESQWATFEEPDHGFDDPYADDDAWSADDDSWGGDSGGDDEGGTLGGLFGVIKGIFFGDD